jgi:imidazolonepropionase-like amidohydrolase
LKRDVPVVPALYFERACIIHGSEFGLSQQVIDGHQETLDAGTASAQRIIREGGRLGMGGDYGFAWNPHGDYAKELTFFVDHVGLSVEQTLVCATRTGAEIIGVEDSLGTLEVGKTADILVVNGDVLNDISLIEDKKNLLAVIQNGIIKAGTLNNSN